MVRRRMKLDLILTGTTEAIGFLLGKASGVTKNRGLQVGHKGKALEFGLVRSTNSQAGDLTDDLSEQLADMARRNQVKVSLESNCGTSLPFRNSVNPWDWDINPWDWDINPWDWDISQTIPRLIPVGATALEGELLFRQQKAFQISGLTDATGERNQALSGHRGAGVVVGVFDTLPDHGVSKPWLTLHPYDGSLEAPQHMPERDLSDHGLMIASLINAIAPDAQVHLYEVCGKDGYGSLYPLLEQLAAFIGYAAGRPAVINLSLGSLCCGGNPSPALTALLQKATDLGMVVIAAAGNQAKSCVKPCNLPPAQMPAGMANVVAVAASNAADHRSTFSQRGDIAAYGGEDVGPVGPGDAEDIIGMGDSVSGYVAMDGGTSFSAPLVAGGAVLALADQLARGAVLGINTYKIVKAAIEAGARQPAGSGTGENLQNDGLGAGILYLPGILGR